MTTEQDREKQSKPGEPLLTEEQMRQLTTRISQMGLSPMARDRLEAYVLGQRSVLQALEIMGAQKASEAERGQV